ncbi:hypothetical protein [Streptomyces sp. NPDC002550]
MTVVERGSAPLVGALGGVIGEIAAQMQRDHGVDLRWGLGVSSLEGDAAGHVRRAELSDGSTGDADVLVASLGSNRNARRAAHRARECSGCSDHIPRGRRSGYEPTATADPTDFVHGRCRLTRAFAELRTPDAGPSSASLVAGRLSAHG